MFRFSFWATKQRISASMFFASLRAGTKTEMSSVLPGLGKA
jgi:hypothetical protein